MTSVAYDPRELWHDLEKYLSAIETFREVLKRDPVWLPETCPVEGCEHYGATEGHLEGVA